MHLVCGDIKVVLEALLAERVAGKIQVADGAPATAVGFVMIGRALGAVILAPGESLVFSAITFSRKVGAAGISAGVRRFGRHK